MESSKNFIGKKYLLYKDDPYCLIQLPKDYSTDDPDEKEVIDIWNGISSYGFEPAEKGTYAQQIYRKDVK